MKLNLIDKKILVTGGAGFLGSHIIEKLLKKGISRDQIIIPRKNKIDLRNWANCVKVIKNIDIVFHIAGNIGGIGYNKRYPGSIFYDNLIMGIQLLEAARKGNVEKFLTVGTICSYPDKTKIPFNEKNLWNGYPAEVTAPYGLAKKMLLVQSQAYYEQYDFNSIYLMPTNLYGPKDNFFEEKSHVIPALVKKVIEAKKNNYSTIRAWGSGDASREFLYVEDAADGIISAMENYNQPVPINLGSGKEISIKNLLKMIIDIIDYKGKVIWDKHKPEGQFRRVLNINQANKEFKFKAHTMLEKGLKKTINWYTNEQVQF